MVWGSLFTVPWFIFIVLAIPSIRKQMHKAWPTFQSSWAVLAVNEFFTFAAGALGMYAMFLAPVTQASAMWGLQPFVILAFASILQRFGVSGVMENTSRASLIKKALLFVVILVGIFLIKD
jgi:drug/metabolite transporter (DMT)-like permease